MREPEARCDARGDRGRRAGADDAVDAARVDETLERDLVVELEDRAAVGQPEAGAPADRGRPRSRGSRARGRPRAGLSAARRARAASRGPPVQWPRDVDPRGAGRGAESRPRARRELDGAPGGRGPGRDGDGAGGLGRGAADASRRRRTRALGQPAGCRRDCRSGRPAAGGGVRERAAGRRRPATAGGRRGEVARERTGASRRVDRDPAAGASRGRRRAHTLGFGNGARSPASHAAGQGHLHGLVAAGRGPRVRRGAARERPRGRARRGRRGAGAAGMGLAAAARRGHGLPRRHALQQDGHARPGRGGGGRRAFRWSWPAR